MGLIGRQSNVDELLRVVTSTTVPLTIITGPPGIGRSAVLGELRDALEKSGIRAFSTRFYSDDHAPPTDLALASEVLANLDAGFDPVAARPTGTTTLYPVPLLVLRSVVGAHGSPAIAARAARAIAEFLREQGCTVLLMDDVQWIDLDLVAVAEALTRRFAGTPFSCVCAIRTPVSPVVSTAATTGMEALSRLLADGLVHEIHLRPLNATHIGALTAAVIQAKPDPNLVDRLQQLSRGTPAAVLAAIDAYQRADSIRVVDRHAYLVRPRRLAGLSPRHDLLAPIGQLGDIGWSAAKAAAVFHPLGAAVPSLVAKALGISERETHQVLEQLRGEGILRFQRAEKTWQFRVPLVADTLVKRCGPYERRQLAYLAVSALSSGRAHTTDPHYLTDQLANAGKLLDPQHTVKELLARAREAVLDEGERADEWLQAAADLTTARESRAQILFIQAMARFVNNDYLGCLDCSTSLLADYRDQLSTQLLQETELLHVRSLHRKGDIDAVERIVSGERLPFSDARPQVLTRSNALVLLGRWRDAYDLLNATRNDWSSNSMIASLAKLRLSLSGLVVGYPEEFERDIAMPGHVAKYRYEYTGIYIRAMLTIGDHHRAEKLVIAKNLPVDGILPLDQASLAALRGQADRAIELHRAAAARGQLLGNDGLGVHSHQAIAMILYARGRLAQVRELLETTRATHPVLPHLLDGPDAMVDRALGEPARAEHRLHHSLAVTAEQGVLVDTDALWLQLTELAVARDDLTWAHVYLTEIERVAERMGTSRALLRRLMGTALVRRDAEAARQAVRLAKERDQPLELARVINKLVQHGVGDPALLPEAYDLLGQLDALFYRARVRDLMRRHNITVPGRQTTLAENERLLAVLVSQGFGNKELATVLRTTEKSIEGRLSRLFSRTGYRSRVELAAAILNGEFPA
ncbi:MAG TPA: AAA family ATPase [Amycolatopsis sp.]|nr:AAA family ATPase [Amycolatopsis sp.]